MCTSMRMRAYCFWLVHVYVRTISGEQSIEDEGKDSRARGTPRYHCRDTGALV
jgi:hypothetical protein